MDDIKDTASEKVLELLEIQYDQFTKTSRPFMSGIQEAQYRMLFYLSNSPQESMTSLGKLMYMSKPYMTTLVDSLTKDGLVERHPDLQDRRVINISITSIGRKKIEEIRMLMRKNVVSRITEMQPEDLEQFVAAVDVIIAISKKYK